MQTSGNNPTVVRYKQVSWRQEFRQTGDYRMGDLTRESIQDQQAGRVSSSKRCLRDEFVRKFIVEIGGTQIIEMSGLIAGHSRSTPNNAHCCAAGIGGSSPRWV